MVKLIKKIKRKSNTLYTGRGDDGTTTLYNCQQGRISKNSNIIEALGSIDELNAYIGVVKVYAEIDKIKLKYSDKKDILLSVILGDVQQILFIIQAEIAGVDMTVKKSNLNKIEDIIESIGNQLPPITSFTISGGSILSSTLDFSRTLARRCERNIVSVSDEKNNIVGKVTIAYLNRLSSLLFALSRYSNYLLSIKEEHPNYDK